MLLSLRRHGDFDGNFLFCLQLYGEVGMEGDKGRDYKKEFFFDYSYWSADPKDQHFINQDQVINHASIRVF